MLFNIARNGLEHQMGYRVAVRCKGANFGRTESACKHLEITQTGHYRPRIAFRGRSGMNSGALCYTNYSCLRYFVDTVPGGQRTGLVFTYHQIELRLRIKQP